LPAEVALESRAAGGPGDFAIPSYAARDRLGCLGRMRQRASQGINEILVGFNRSRFESHIQGRVTRSKNSVDATTRRRRCEFTRIDGQDVGLVAIAEVPGCRHRLMVFRQLFASLPHALREDLEVPE